MKPHSAIKTDLFADEHHQEGSEAPKILYAIIKADDLSFEVSLRFFLSCLIRLKPITFITNLKVLQRWRRFLKIAKTHEVPASLGIIGKSIEKKSNRFHNFVKEILKEGNHEIFNHGYHHQRLGVYFDGTPITEFNHTPLQEQVASLRKTQQLMLEFFNYTPETFGAPEQKEDEKTEEALQAVPELKTWFHGYGTSCFIVNMTAGGDIERPLFRPNSSWLRDSFNTRNSLYVLQAHPGAWNNNDFKEFEQALIFLKSKNVIFVTAARYRALNS